MKYIGLYIVNKDRKNPTKLTFTAIDNYHSHDPSDLYLPVPTPLYSPVTLTLASST